jgi:hypothetical protein
VVLAGMVLLDQLKGTDPLDEKSFCGKVFLLG